MYPAGKLYYCDNWFVMLKIHKDPTAMNKAIMKHRPGVYTKDELHWAAVFHYDEDIKKPNMILRFNLSEFTHGIIAHEISHAADLIARRYPIEQYILNTYSHDQFGEQRARITELLTEKVYMYCNAYNIPINRHRPIGDRHAECE